MPVHYLFTLPSPSSQPQLRLPCPPFHQRPGEKMHDKSQLSSRAAEANVVLLRRQHTKVSLQHMILGTHEGLPLVSLPVRCKWCKSSAQNLRCASLTDAHCSCCCDFAI